MTNDRRDKHVRHTHLFDHLDDIAASIESIKLSVKEGYNSRKHLSVWLKSLKSLVDYTESEFGEKDEPGASRENLVPVHEHPEVSEENY